MNNIPDDYLNKHMILSDESMCKTADFQQKLEDDQFYKKSSVGIDSILKATKKLLAINKGETEPDERDSFVYRKVYDVDDLISERARMDADKIRNNIMFKLSKSRSLKYLPNGVFDSYATGHIIGSPLSLPSEEVNPLFNRDQQTRMTVFGQGGIGSADAVTEDAQNVHPSQFGFVDVIASPECIIYNPIYEVLTSKGFISIKDISYNDRIACFVNNTVEFHNPEKIVKEEYSGDIYNIRNEFIAFEITPNHRIKIFNPQTFDWQITTAQQLYNANTDCYFPIFSPDNFKNDYNFLQDERGYITPNNITRFLYEGEVWCLKVPGSLFCIRCGKWDTAFWTGNSEKIGVDMRLAYNTRIHKKSGKLLTQVRDRTTGEIVWMTPEEIKDNIVAFPNE